MIFLLEIIILFDCCWGGNLFGAAELFRRFGRFQDFGASDGVSYFRGLFYLGAASASLD